MAAGNRTRRTLADVRSEIEEDHQAFGGLKRYRSSRSGRPMLNTFSFTSGDGAEVVRFHETDIARRSADGKIRISSGGWRTPTTLSRINDVLRLWNSPASVGRRGGIWYVYPDGFAGSRRPVPFEDDMRVYTPRRRKS